MLKRWRKPKCNITDFNKLLNQAENVLKDQKTIVFAPNNTNANWLGIKNATLGMFPEQTIILPQHYSNTLLSKEQRVELFTKLQSLQVETIIFSGIPNYTLEWIEELHHNFNLKIGIIYHGGLAELTSNSNRQKQMQRIINFGNQNVIQKIGVVKEGLDEWFKQKTKCTVHRVLPQLSIPNGLKIKKFNDNKTHIGVFGNATYNKNRHTQVVAASMVENSVVHILAPNEFDYTIPKDRLVIHENLSRTEFLELLGSMTINLYCSYSESWGQVVLESFMLGTPCLFSCNSGLQKFIGEEYLVEEYDNPYSIAKKIKASNFIITSEVQKNIEKKISTDFTLLS